MVRKLIIFFLYLEWFKNINGIKGFAEQCITRFEQKLARFTARIKKRIKKWSEEIKTHKNELLQRQLQPVVEEDEYATVKQEDKGYKRQSYFIVGCEGFFNFFAAKAIFNFPGWLALAGQILFAFALTWISIPLFRNLLVYLINEKKYKSTTEAGRRNIIKLVCLLLVCIGYEISIYALCKVRGEQIEGSDGGFITTMLIIVGMLLPIIAGYFAFERRKYYAPYINTKKIKRLEALIAYKENAIQTNFQKMENYFKHEIQVLWAFFQEFKTYKENYNRKHSIPEEDLSGHFAEKESTFLAEAVARYKKVAIMDDNIQTVNAEIIYDPAEIESITKTAFN